MTFKIGDYVIDDNRKVVLHITNKKEKAIINAHGGYRHATEDEIELYHMMWSEEK